MKANYRRVPTEFAPDTEFEVKPVAAVLREANESRFEQLKTRLLLEWLEESAPELAANGEAQNRVRRAAGEAAALAWVTQYPLLVFPLLFAEKAGAALVQAQRQDWVRQRSREWLAV